MTITLEDLEKETTDAELNGEEVQAENVENKDVEPNAEPKDEVTEKSNDDVKDEKPSDKGVPQARLSEVIAERNREREEKEALLKRIAELEAGTKQEQKAEPEIDFDTKISELIIAEQEALLDGDTEKSKQIGIEKAKLIKDENLRVLRAERAAESKVESEQTLLSSAISLSVQTYPMLDQGSESYDQKAVIAINKLASANALNGMSKHEALLDAVKEVAEMKGWTQPAKANAKEDGRKKDALNTALATNKSQPPMIDGIGNRVLSGVDVKSLSQEDYEKMSEKDRMTLLQ